ncbi:MAG: hypothetical protein GF417_01605 [Candidatus Latescibacteria bacterium]|nr:hypothetical protein [bacterium]MBD3423122.1 hypothetical protein [Candidatus Latescibacterota bacterium]
MKRNRSRAGFVAGTVLMIMMLSSSTLLGSLPLGPEQTVQAGGSEISVPGFSVPSLIEWNGDGLPDLIVGEGGLGIDPGKVRVYLNQGAPGAPQFQSYFYAQSEGSDLERPSGG